MARLLHLLGLLALLTALTTALTPRLQASDPGPGGASDSGGQLSPTSASGRPPVLLAQKGGTKKKGTAKKATAGEETAAPTTEKAAGGDSGVKFSRDIAPVLVGNCIGCHNPERRRGKFDLTTYEKLMAGSDVEKVIEPGKPDESHLVLRLRGEETPKMPQGNNNNLSDEAIARITSWVKAGARLDAGIDPKAPLRSYAPTPEQLRAAELKKLPTGERDKMVETVGRKRWKQASPKTTPEVTSDTHFLLFSTLPKDRAGAVLKSMDAAYAQLRAILSRPGEPALEWAEKTSLFVFPDTTSFVEFVRTQENREIEAGDTGTAQFGTPEPYVAVTAPPGGQAAFAGPGAAPGRRASRARRGEDESASRERSVAGLLAEQLAMGVLKAEKNTPGWLCLGLGGYFAAALDPRSSYVQQVRSTAAANFQQGWTSRANDALGGQLKAEDTRAIGYAFVDWMTHDPQTRRYFPAFAQGMIADGGAKLDEVLQEVFGAGIRRQDFLYSAGAWAARYGAAR
jgi:mono/diheme cytochrome c family protein